MDATKIRFFSETFRGDFAGSLGDSRFFTKRRVLNSKLPLLKKLSAIETQLGNFFGSFTTGSCRSSKKTEAADFCDILEKNHWVVVGVVLNTVNTVQKLKIQSSKWRFYFMADL